MDNTAIAHNERYKQMVKDVDSRTTHWYYGSDPGLHPCHTAMTAMMQVIAGFGVPMGPFTQGYFDKECMGIPNYRFNNIGGIPDNDEVDMVFFATNALTTNLLRTSWGMMTTTQEVKKGNAPIGGYMGMCVQTAITPKEEIVVVAADLYSVMRPQAYYEHPPGHRLVMAMNGETTPEQSALVVRFKIMESDKNYTDILNDMTKAFQNRQVDDVPEVEFQQLMFKLWSQQ